MTDLSVSSGRNKETAQNQIQRILEAAVKAKDEEIRIRVPVFVRDPEDGQYTQIRDAYWHLRMPTETASVERVEEILEAVGQCLTLIGEQGAPAVLARLSTSLERTAPETNTDTDGGKET